MSEKNHPSILVIKVGTGVLTLNDNSLNLENIKAISKTLAKLQNQGHHACVLVSSGSVASGAQSLELSEYPRSLVTKQVCASIGQPKLIQAYRDELSLYGLEPAQILMTHDDLHHHERKINLKNMLNSILETPQLIPIINQNDSVATEELNLGDNDHLAVALAIKLGAKKLFLLTSVDGLLDPSTDNLISEIKTLDEAYAMVDPKNTGHFSMGGMHSKLQAVEKAQNANINCYILNGNEPQRILEHEDDSFIGTKFL